MTIKDAVVADFCIAFNKQHKTLNQLLNITDVVKINTSPSRTDSVQRSLALSAYSKVKRDRNRMVTQVPTLSSTLTAMLK